MSSIFTTSEQIKIKSAFGKDKSVPFYLQFVPGVCVESITSITSIKSMYDEQNVNSIIALSHVRNGSRKQKSNLDGGNRYYPLLRGIFEVPAKGDPVLLCTVGGIQYYLGPLNTTNSPNFNSDNLWEPEIKKDSGALNVESDSRLSKGESPNFVKKNFHRMVKPYNPKLDGEKTFNETHGDIMVEGRHGNSIRVGSRGENPYITFSNGRQTMYTTEGFADGTLISIINYGSLNQHFGGFAKQIGTTTDGSPIDIEIVDGFTLASDYVDESTKEKPPKRFMANLIKSVNGDVDAQQLVYEYGKDTIQNQILTSSDRITINSKSDDIYLSSNKDIHIGTKRHLTISTNKNLIIDSEKTYLGDFTKNTMDNMVLGKKLQQVLKDIIGLFKEIKTPTMMGPQMPLPLPSELAVITAIDDILSTKHFIEENTKKKK